MLSDCCPIKNKRNIVLTLRGGTTTGDLICKYLQEVKNEFHIHQIWVQNTQKQFFQIFFSTAPGLGPISTFWTSFTRMLLEPKIINISFQFFNRVLMTLLLSNCLDKLTVSFQLFFIQFFKICKISKLGKWQKTGIKPP